MKDIAFTGDWTITFVHPQTRKKRIIPATVPGNIAADLMRAKILPDLYAGANVLVAQQWERVDFTYAASLAAPTLKKGESLELNFGGVDTAASVMVNGKQVAFLENMFIPHAVDITPHLAKNGKNTLAVTIHNVMDYSAARAKRWGIDGFEFNHLPFYESIFVRKAQHMFGWDIAPRILFGGLWRPVTLRIRAQSEILPEEFHVAVRSVDVAQALAEVEIAYGLSLDPKSDWHDYELHIEGRCGDSVFSRVTPLHFTHGKERFSIPNAKLWWPLGYGEQPLYDVTATLRCRGKEIDAYTTRVGLRTVALDFNADLANPANNRFQIVVNGIGIFARGSNWVPADVIHACDRERIPKILSMWVDTHCNIVRCWGGNVYEDHAFFDFCDEHGIMVWQDFMLACARYPHTDEFLQQIRDEARTIVRRLRNHPSLVLWAGDNEIDSSYQWVPPGHTMPSQNQISRVILKEAVAFHAPFTPYLPSSPYVTDEMHATGRYDAAPEQHLWGPRGYFKDDFYAKNSANFASEIGYHGMPSKRSMKRFLSKGKVWGSFNNNEWILHAANYTEREDSPMGKRNLLMLSQVRHLFGDSVDVSDIDDFICASQITQAEAKKYFIEHFRSRKPHKTGIIWWNMIDGWPQFSDAVVDYYFEKKLAYDYIKRSQTPVCIMVAEHDDKREIVAVNDTLKPVRGTWKISAGDAATPTLRGSYNLPPNGRTSLGTLKKSRKPAFYTIEWTANGKPCRNHYVDANPPWDFTWYREHMAKLRSELSASNV